ncbi:ImuA family protein [Thalassoroseus pseudoceratinae]|uniref:ImuA family protein n=1 Tax=Thalassoroseus pseudoceratinae TaxID=2713176 RepID=UPI0014232785|nr:hypothetical protein [Thalassoroseus pseudoceratinae]
MAMLATSSASSKDTVERLRKELRQWERPTSEVPQHDAISTGIAVLDDVLPDSGIGAGEIVEWQTERGGAWLLTMLQLRAVLTARSAGMAVVIDDAKTFSPVAAMLLGVDLDRLIIVRSKSANQAVWVMEQCLRCSGVVAVCGRLGAISETSARRLKLAARTGGGVGLFFRDESRNRQRTGSWSDIRWRVEPVAVSSNLNDFQNAVAGRRLRVELVSCRTGRAGKTVEIDICDETGLVREAPRVAPATGQESFPLSNRRRQTRSFQRTG